MTSLIPSFGQIRHIRINQMMCPVSPVPGGRLFMFQCSIDASAPNSDDLCDVLFSISGAKQFPDLLMATHALGIAALAFLFDVPRRSGLRWRKRLSSKLPRRFFEHTLMVTKELLQGFGEILLQMKAIDNLFGLGSPMGGCFAEDLAPITRDHLDFGMLFEPGGTRLHRTLREEISYPPMFEVHQNGAIACPLLPGPLINSSHTN